MKIRLLVCSMFLAVFAVFMFVPAATVHAQPVPGTACDLTGGSFLGFPTWYKYLQGSQTLYGCVPQIHKLADIWLIVMAVIEIMLRIAALLAILLVAWGGVKFVTSQGDPSGTKAARETITNALIGVVIAVSATAVVSFIAGRFSQ